MTINQGSIALSSDYNTLRGEVNRWFADNYAGIISFGNVNQTYGWGGSEAAAVVQGNNIIVSEMNSLVDRCNVGEDICNNVTGVLPQITAGDLMPSTDYSTIETKSDLITTNRLDVEAAEMSIGLVGQTSRSSSWSAAINCTLRHTFTSFDKARYYFNSGGAVTVWGTISGYSTGTGWDGAAFDEILTDMGSIMMNYTQTTQSGSGGTPTSIGYYDLTSTFQTIFSQAGTGAYTDATLVLSARASGGGAYIELRITLTPGSGRSVDGTTAISTDQRKLNNQSSGGASLIITAPSYSLIDPL